MVLITIHTKYKMNLHTEKNLLNQQVSSAGIGTANFIFNIYKFFGWIYRFFINSTDDSVECTEKSVRFTDLQTFVYILQIHLLNFFSACWIRKNDKRRSLFWILHFLIHTSSIFKNIKYTKKINVQNHQ